MSDHDDVTDQLVGLLEKQITSGQAQAQALGSVAVELGAIRGKLDVLPRVETALKDATQALTDARGAYADLAERKASDVARREARVREEGIAEGRRLERVDAESSPVASARWSAATAIRSTGGQAALLTLIVAVVYGLVHMALPGLALPPIPGTTP